MRWQSVGPPTPSRVRVRSEGMFNWTEQRVVRSYETGMKWRNSRFYDLALGAGAGTRHLLPIR